MKQQSSLTLCGIKASGQRILLLAALLLVEFHLFYSAFYHVLPWMPLRNIERWAGLVLLGSFLFLLPKSFAGLKSWMKSHRSYEMLFLMFLFFWNILTCLLRHLQTGRPTFRENDWWIFVSGLVAFQFFPLAGILGKDRFKCTIEMMFKIVIFPHAVFYAWTLWQYAHKNYVTFPSGVTLMKTLDHRMSIAEPNTTSACCLAMLGLCLYMVFTQKSMRKVPYLFGAAIYFTGLVMANSRTCWYAVLLMAVLICICGTGQLMKKKRFRLQLLCGLLLSAVCVLAMYGARGGIFRLLDRTEEAADLQASMSAQTAAQTAAQTQTAELRPLSGHHNDEKETAKSTDKYDRPLSNDRYSGLNGRIDIYKAVLFLLFTSRYRFLFGVTVADTETVLQGIYGVEEAVHAHNIFLQTGLCFGVPAMLGMLVFLILLLICCYRVMFLEKDRLFHGAWMIPVLLISLMLVDMLECFLNYSNSIICPVFYLFAGWLVELNRKVKKPPSGRIAEEGVLSKDS